MRYVSLDIFCWLVWSNCWRRNFVSHLHMAHTHTHGAPAVYTAQLEPCLVDAHMCCTTFTRGDP